jgi:hypothetical protein
MIAFTLNVLVLRGVVRTDELGVLRLFGVQAPGNHPGTSNPVLPPARTGPDADVATADVGYPTKGVSPRAGRSCRQAESFSRQQVAKNRAVSSWRDLGGSARAAAAIARALAAGFVATVGETNPRTAIESLGMLGRMR